MRRFLVFEDAITISLDRLDHLEDQFQPFDLAHDLGLQSDR